MNTRYFVQRKSDTGTWENCDLKGGHVSYAFCRRLALRIKESNPDRKIRILCRFVKVEEFPIEEF